MPNKPHHLIRPTDLEDALSHLAKPGAVPLAGGTRLLDGGNSVEIAVDLQGLGLDTIDLYEYELYLGATAKLSTIANTSEISGAPRDLLREAIEFSGPSAFREKATIGGIVAGREADSELLAVLLVLEAKLLFAHNREMSLKEYLAPDEKPDGLIIEIRIPWWDGRGALTRISRTPADSPVVSVVAWQPTDEMIRLAAVGITPRPIRLPDAGADFKAAIQAAQDATIHAGDLRGSKDYRREMVGTLVQRAINSLR